MGSVFTPFTLQTVVASVKNITNIYHFLSTGVIIKLGLNNHQISLLLISFGFSFVCSFIVCDRTSP